MDEFNDLLSSQKLTEAQLSLCRDIRRRGKNKIAAHNCRSRRLSQLEELRQRLEEAKANRDSLAREQRYLVDQYRSEASRLSNLTEQVLRQQNISPAQYTLQVKVWLIV